MKLDPNLVSVRDLTEADIPPLLNYWFRSPPGFIEAMGVDPGKLPSEEEMRGNIAMRIREQVGNALIIQHGSDAIGMHTINPPHEGDFGIFHAHIWIPEFRGRGVGLICYPLACRKFIERFNLKRILFKTPVQNTSAIRVKEKLGIRCIGEETVGFGIIREGTRAKVFELMREEAANLAVSK